MDSQARTPLWWDDASSARYPALDGERTFDVAVIGAGIAGLTTAMLLKRQGAKVAVVEADRVAGGTTGANTAKVTALQSTMYSQIRSSRGAEAAAVYADACKTAVAKVAELRDSEDIDCQLRRRAACTYAMDDEELRGLESESEAARDAGLPTVLGEHTDLPFPVRAALRLDDQVGIQPVLYAQGLARAIDGDGCAVFERSRVLAMTEGAPCQVSTAAGSVSADHVVVATHYPAFDRGLYFARLEPHRSYCIASRLTGDSPPHDMAINVGSPKRSIHSYGEILVVGGEGHPAGERRVTTERYEHLEEFARTHWSVAEVTHRWSAQDPTAYDHFPMVGPYLPTSSRVFVASGFMKWGLAGGTVAALVIADRIAGRSNPWAAEFTPNRVTPRQLSVPAVGDFLRMNGKVAAEFVGDRLVAGQGETSSIPRGQAGIVRKGVRLMGVYRDESGQLHAVSLRCTHLGCLLRFNGAERTWDCPCHGSRFDVDGEIIEGPALKPLSRENPPEE